MGANQSLAKMMLMMSLALFGAALYLSFIVPRSVEAWAATGMALTNTQALAANLSTICRTYGILLYPLLLLVLVGSWIWLKASMRNRLR